MHIQGGIFGAGRLARKCHLAGLPPGSAAPTRPAAVAALAARTEGRTAGLQLAALSLRGQPDAAGFVAAFSGSRRYVLDYLTGEMLERQDEQVRGFSLETSVLERLARELGDTEHSARLRTGGTFVPEPRRARFHLAGPPSGDALSDACSYRPRRTVAEDGWDSSLTDPRHGD